MSISSLIILKNFTREGIPYLRIPQSFGPSQLEGKKVHTVITQDHVKMVLQGVGRLL